jgi:uncharacterized protein YndB with AHSA1/START domain
MHTARAIRTIHAPVARVWAAWAAFDGIADFHPDVARSPALNDIPSGVGAERECHFHDGNSIKERVTDSRSERRLEIEIYDVGPFPFKTANSEITLAPRGANETEVTFAMHYVPKYGPVGWLLAKTVLNAQVAKALDGVLKGLDDHLRTGKNAGSGDGAPGVPAEA